MTATTARFDMPKQSLRILLFLLVTVGTATFGAEPDAPGKPVESLLLKPIFDSSKLKPLAVERLTTRRQAVGTTSQSHGDGISVSESNARTQGDSDGLDGATGLADRRCADHERLLAQR